MASQNRSQEKGMRGNGRRCTQVGEAMHQGGPRGTLGANPKQVGQRMKQSAGGRAGAKAGYTQIGARMKQ